MFALLSLGVARVYVLHEDVMSDRVGAVARRYDGDGLSLTPHHLVATGAAIVTPSLAGG